MKEETSVFAEESVHDLGDLHGNLMLLLHDVAGQVIWLILECDEGAVQTGVFRVTTNVCDDLFD